MKDFAKKYQENKTKHLALWKELIDNIFNGLPADSVTITERNRIVEILNKIGKSEAEHHTFLPKGGGDDLFGSVFSNEEGLVELNFDGNDLLINPTTLTFHPIGENPEWWFFRIDTSPFNRSGVYEESQHAEDEKGTFKSSSQKDLEWTMSFIGEEVLELTPGEYEDRGLWDNGFLGYDEDGRELRFPDTARIVTRMFNGGAYVIFPKYSLYNENSGTYDGRHNKFSNEEFADYVKTVVDGLEKRLKN
ncbi:serine/threonine protein kinase [Bacillus atrophaeus]|uniref:serine/threonine protein kinase n=1 Tax=Bacillus atrophaeus TaxID=1452 RepID=UPI002280B136|nr:serine/threonine protein kinase [Bacillus atrophaeus]MCY9198918.1 serine/threonine protein kinase [Bacillus atrophaeus]